MQYTMTAPCKACPFRNDGEGIRLRNGRAEDILNTLIAQQGVFSCHETVDYDAEDVDSDFHIPGKDEQHCAGAMIMLEHLESPNQMMRIAERTNGYDRRKLKMDSPVFDDEEGCLDYHEG